MLNVCVYFFFQAEDGIRYLTVTGVQTCALPILLDLAIRRLEKAEVVDPGEGRQRGDQADVGTFRRFHGADAAVVRGMNRSEERRVGKECRSRWSPYH